MRARWVSLPLPRDSCFSRPPLPPSSSFRIPLVSEIEPGRNTHLPSVVLRIPWGQDGLHSIVHPLQLIDEIKGRVEDIWVELLGGGGEPRLAVAAAFAGAESEFEERSVACGDDGEVVRHFWKREEVSMNELGRRQARP